MTQKIAAVTLCAALFVVVAAGCSKKADISASAPAASQTTGSAAASPAPGYAPASDNSADAQKYRALQQQNPNAKAPYAR